MKNIFRRKKPIDHQSANLFVFIREGDKDTFWPLHKLSHAEAGTLIGLNHEQSTPEHVELVNVISFSPLDDVEMRAQRRETTKLLTKRLMAETGLRLIGWRQFLGQASKPSINAGDFRKRFKQSTEQIFKSLSSLNQKNVKGDPSARYQDRLRALVGSEWLYATPGDRMATAPNNVCIWPGRAILRKLLAQAWSEQPQPESPYVTGVVFSGSLHTLVVFFKATDSGELESMVSVDLPNATSGTESERLESNTLRLQQALQNYLQHVRLAALDSASDFPQERICLFDGVEFVKQIAEKKTTQLLRPYPKEQEVLGIGSSTWWSVTSNLSATLLIGIVLTSIYASTSIQWSKHSTTVLASDLETTKSQLRLAILNRWGAITKEGSAPIAKAIRIAQDLYVEGVRFEIEADRQTLLIKSISKVNHPANTPSALMQLINNTPPQGCSRRNPETNMQLSELYITYECSSINHGISNLLAGNR